MLWSSTSSVRVMLSRVFWGSEAKPQRTLPEQSLGLVLGNRVARLGMSGKLGILRLGFSAYSQGVGF